MTKQAEAAKPTHVIMFLSLSAAMLLANSRGREFSVSRRLSLGRFCCRDAAMAFQTRPTTGGQQPSRRANPLSSVVLHPTAFGSRFMGKYDASSSSRARCGFETSAAKMSSSSDNDLDAKCALDDIQRVFAISDLHTDNVSNFAWLSNRCTPRVGSENDDADDKQERTNNTPGPMDALIVAGDISHELSTLQQTLTLLVSKLKCHVFFVFGNHEAWIGGKEMDHLGLYSSLQKLEAVTDLCHTLGVHTAHHLVGASHLSPVWILPIQSWYDGTLSVDECEDLCQDFATWPWVDFVRCHWPVEYNTNSPPLDSEQSVNNNTGRIPRGLTELFLQRNELSIFDVQKHFRRWQQASSSSSSSLHSPSPPGLITFSHFLPNQQTLPDWKDPQSEVFFREEWLDHPVPEISAKFAKVAGSSLVDDQIRSIPPFSMVVGNNDDGIENVRHLHIFGHSHRPKDFYWNGIRYIHNPLGKPVERDMYLVSKHVDFQLVWDTTTKDGEVVGEQIIRYWEEKGGGRERLARRMKRRKQKRRLEMRRLKRDIELLLTKTNNNS